LELFILVSGEPFEPFDSFDKLRTRSSPGPFDKLRASSPGTGRAGMLRTLRAVNNSSV